MQYELEIQDSGEKCVVEGDDPQDAAMKWAANQTLAWWRRHQAEHVVLVKPLCVRHPETLEIRISVDYDLTAEKR